MATIYVRSDGTAANYAAAADAGSSAANSLSISRFNTDQGLGAFQPGDEVIFTSLGGTFLTSVTGAPPTIVQGGSGSSSHITYIGDPSNIPTFENDTASQNTFIISGASSAIDYITVKDIICDSSASSVTEAFSIPGEVGNANNFSVYVTDVTVTNPYGDCFNQTDGLAHAGHINYTRCSAINPGSISASGDQGYTAHKAAQSATMIDCTSAGGMQGIQFAGGSTFTWSGGSITDFVTHGVLCNSGASTLTNVTIDAQGKTGRVFDTGTGSLEFIDCTIVQDRGVATDGLTLFIRGDVTINGGSFTFDSNDKNIQMTNGSSLTLGSSASGNLTFTVNQCDFSFITDLGATALYTLTTEGVFWDLTGFGAVSNGGRLIECADGMALEATANIFYNAGAAVSSFINIASDATSAKIYNNVFYDIPNYTDLIADGKSSGTATEIYNNIFYNCGSDVIGKVGQTDAQYNNYSGGSTSEGDTGDNTDDPLFTNAGGLDFSLSSSSTLIGAGLAGSATTYNDYRGLAYLDPPNMGSYSQTTSGGGSSVINPNTSFNMDKNGVRGDIGTATGVTTPTADQITFYIGTGIDVNLRQSIVGTLQILQNYATDFLPNLAIATNVSTLNLALGAGKGDIRINDATAAGDITLIVGENIVNGGVTRQIDVPVDYMTRDFLELSTGNG